MYDKDRQKQARNKMIEASFLWKINSPTLGFFKILFLKRD